MGPEATVPARPAQTAAIRVTRTAVGGADFGRASSSRLLRPSGMLVPPLRGCVPTGAGAGAGGRNDGLEDPPIVEAVELVLIVLEQGLEEVPQLRVRARRLAKLATRDELRNLGHQEREPIHAARQHKRVPATRRRRRLEAQVLR